MEPEKRSAPDGIAYSHEEFLQHYGQEYGMRRWDNAAPPLSAREHSFDADATEHSDAPVGGEQHAAPPVSATQHTIDADATELSDATHPDSVPSSGQGNRRTVMQNLPTETRLVLTSVQDIYWAPPPPEKLKGTWRGIKEILEITAKWKSTSAAWNKFDNIATNLSDDRTLAHLPWTNILSELIDTAFHHQRDESPTSITFSKWQKAVVSQDMDTIDGLFRFLTRWTETDQLVKQWVTREMLVSRASADLGGWLADYVNTTYALLTKCAKTGVVYKVVHNQVYASLAKQLEEFFFQSARFGPTTLLAMSWSICAGTHSNGATPKQLYLCWLSSGTQPIGCWKTHHQQRHRKAILQNLLTS